MSPFTRRDFIKTTIAAGAAASLPALPLHAAAPSATDKVTLGKSGLQVTRLAFGTGTNNGYVQASLGQKEFTRLIRYAYDHGIRFYETAEAYAAPGMLGVALKGLPATAISSCPKVTTDEGVDPAKRFDDMLRTAPRPTTSTSCSSTGSTPITGPSHNRALAGRHPRPSSTRRPSAPAAPPSTACPPSVRCPATSGSRSP